MIVLSICTNTLCVGINKERDKELSLVGIEKSKGNQHKLKGNKFHSNLKKNNCLSTVMFSKHWNKLTSGTVLSASSEMTKTQLSTAQSNLP